MTVFTRRTWYEIDLDRLTYNIGVIRAHLSPGCDIMAVVKSDCYAQGAVELSRHLYEIGIRNFAVATLSEAMTLRKAGLHGNLLVLGYTPPGFAGKLAEFGLSQTVVDIHHARALEEAAARAGVTVEAHIKVDTGMTRTGFDCMKPSDVDELASVYELPHLHPIGIYSHFASSDDPSPGADEYCRFQMDRFFCALDALGERGIDVGKRHFCNSGGTQQYPEAHLDFVRVGSLMAGYDTAPNVEPWGLKKIGSLKTTVSMVREVKEGTPVSYGRTFTAPRDMRVATLSAGYADGYPRALSNKGRVIIRGRWADVLGTVCMDQMMADVTDIPGVESGDTATLFGEDGGLSLSADELAPLCSSSTLEILTRVGRRVQRVYHKNGEVVRVIDYTDQDAEI